MKITVRFLSTLALLASIANAATSPVGSTPGAFAVLPSGAATYTIPIEVPPGINGMQPEISLVYNSQAGNGIAGVGWSIGGLSEITRCGATIDRDGFKGGVNLDANDKFCLNGQRLIAISGAYGAAGTEYRTEIESFSKIVQFGGGAQGPIAFQIWTKDGEYIEYGMTNGAAQFAYNNGAAFAWKISKATNRVGDHVSYFYSTDSINTGQHRIERIDYTLRNGAPIGGVTRSVKFIYAARSDTEVAYVGGTFIYSPSRLTNIQTFLSNFATPIRDYRLTYEATVSAAANRSRLVNVQECSADGVCLQGATAFGWQNTSNTFTSEVLGNSGTTTATKKFADFNGDGKTDIIEFRAGASYVALSTGSNFSAFAQWGSGHGTSSTIQVGDYNGDGKGDVLVVTSGSANVWLSTGSGFAAGALWATGVEGDAVADMNGDGRDDVFDKTSDDTYRVWVSTGTSFSPYAIWGSGGWPNLYDFNGDGLTDALVDKHTHFSQHLSTGTGFVTSTWTRFGDPYPYLLGDFNGDGKTDIVYIDGGYDVALSTGSNFPAVTSWGTGSNGSEKVGDFNGDGKMDIIRDGQFVGLSTGHSFTPFIRWGDASGTANTYEIADVSGDGRQDVIRLATSGAWVKFAAGLAPDLLISISTTYDLTAYVTTQVAYKTLTDTSVYTKDTYAAYPVKDAQEAKYVVSSFSALNGAGGMNTTSYIYAGMKEHQTGRGDLGFQRITITAPDNSVTTTDYIQDFPYTGTPLSSSTMVNGAPVSSLVNWIGVMAFDGATSTIWQPSGTTGGIIGPEYFSTTACTMTATRRCYPWVAQADTTINELSGAFVSSAKARTNTPDAYGNFQYSSSESNDAFVQSTNTVFYNDTVNWRLGLPVKTSVTNTVPLAFSSTGAAVSGTRTAVFVYDTLGRVVQEVVQPATNTASSASYAPTYTLGADSVVTTYAYDATYGYRSSSTLSGLNVTSRTTTTAMDFVSNTVTTTNAAGHSEMQTLDPRFGVPTSLKGPNNLYTYWDYDGFGRKIKERRADGTYSTIDVGYCVAAGCNLDPELQPAVSWSQSQNFDKLGGAMSGSFTFLDALGREIRTTGYAFSGLYVNKDTVYDAFGRVSKSSANRYTGGAPNWTTFGYDALGRVTNVTSPDGSVTTTTYSGLTTTVTLPYSDGKTRTKIEKKTTTGLLDTVTDAINGKVVYKYDAFGNLAKVTNTGADGKTSTITSTFDIRGRKIATTDPDMGSWSYTYNAFGELVSQKDAKAQTVTMTYDALGRMISRSEPEGTSTWIFDKDCGGVTALANGTGKLGCVKGPTNSYARAYIYDGLGRISRVATSINTDVFNIDTSYNVNTGRVESTTYPTAGGASLVTYNNYKSYGYLESVSSGPNGTGTVYWRQTAGDADGNVTSETLGNGVTTTRTFDPVRGLLTDIDTTGSFGTVQDLHYDYYAGVPNLSRRVDNQRAYTENFTYDALNRLLGVTGSRTITYAYDSLGNISKKTDFGSTYTYGQKATDNFAGPHAVTTVKNGTTTVATYKYDKNGNQFSGGGRTTTYTSYNLPKTVTSTAENMSFAYDPERNRIIHVSNGNTMLYLSPRWDTGTHYTKETKTNGTVEHKHYIYANGPVALYTVTVTGSTITKETHYLHKDHLGSVQSITDSTGKVTTMYRYDPFGKQELVTGSTAITHHGFTGHEMHNGAGFIHMNGRTFDPKLGRFMQADPNIDGVTHLQGFNRYSYVQNNPLSFTDPSGFLSIGGIKIANPFKEIEKILKRWERGLEKNWEKYRKVIVTVAVVAAVAYTGGAAYNAYAAYGAASAGAAAGMATGALTGAIAGWQSGGNLAAAIRGGIQAAIIGGFTGAIGGSFGTGTLGRMMNGGLNGYMQTGTAEGYWRGMLSGAVPTDLGMTSAYMNNAWANAAIGIMRDGIRGYVINGVRGARMNIAMSLATNAVAHGVGYFRTGSFGEFRRGSWSYTVSSLPSGCSGCKTDAVTIGNVVYYNGSTAGEMTKDYSSWLISHELEHSQNQSALGAAYLPVNGLSQLTGSYYMEESPYTAYPYGSNPTRTQSEPTWYW